MQLPVKAPACEEQREQECKHDEPTIAYGCAIRLALEASYLLQQLRSRQQLWCRRRWRWAGDDLGAASADGRPCA
jgi:hypothetical protein